MADEAPPWLLAMRSMNGLSEKPGSADETKILAMADEIARIFPDMKSYCDGYNHDSIPWCGLCVADCTAKSGIRPPFGSSDTDRFLWARSWADDPNYTVLKTPRLGCIVVLTRSGGGHVTLYESTSGSNYMCRGGNQSDAINLAAFPKSNVVALVWPSTAPVPEPGVPSAEGMPVLRKGDTGKDVVLMQTLLPKWIDGDFGSTTEALVKEFQRSEGLEADGIVGERTWAALLEEDIVPPGIPPADAGWFYGITATVFGNFEGEKSAYGGTLDDSKPFIALPDRFEGNRPLIEVMNSANVIVTATIEDVGPWMTTDDYWAENERPIAESCYHNQTPIPSGPQKGRVPSNPAGIDLSPSLAKSLGIQGMGKVAWRFKP
jgi:uncharacterized protein (TIGR02594 family)